MSALSASIASRLPGAIEPLTEFTRRIPAMPEFELTVIKNS
jgi:hypothetical protein